METTFEVSTIFFCDCFLWCNYVYIMGTNRNQFKSPLFQSCLCSLEYLFDGSRIIDGNSSFSFLLSVGEIKMERTDSASWCLQDEIVFACVHVPIPELKKVTGWRWLAKVQSEHQEERAFQWLLMWNHCWWQSSWLFYLWIHRDFYSHQGLQRKVSTAEISSDQQVCGDICLVDFRGQKWVIIGSLRQL